MQLLPVTGCSPSHVSSGDEAALDGDTLLLSDLSRDRDIGYQAWGWMG